MGFITCRWEAPGPRTAVALQPIDAGGSLEQSVEQALACLRTVGLLS